MVVDGPGTVFNLAGRRPAGIVIVFRRPSETLTQRIYPPDSGVDTAHGGTGSGLRISKRIVDGHGRESRVSESIDGGPRFEITGVECDGKGNDT